MRYFIEISYLGTGYHGWQIQPNAITIQEVLENCMSKILNSKIKLIGAGRTDSGVHANQMFAHFDFDYKIINSDELIYKLNSFLPKKIVINDLIMVKNENRYIAGALNFLGGNTIYGRNWGCIEDHKNLHFEVCYYRAIEYAISKKFRKVEAGAQGAHKISRGYQPEKTFSAHWIKDIDFSEAISNYLEDERLYIQDNIEKLNEYIPFKKNKENQWIMTKIIFLQKY